jgi:hypothetical protein
LVHFGGTHTRNKENTMDNMIALVTQSRHAVPRVGKAVTGFGQHCLDSGKLLGLIGVLVVSITAQAQVLRTASNFAVLGATPSVTNTGASVVTGSVGVYPAAAISGFPPGLIAPGTGNLHFADVVAQQAQADNTTAFGTLTGLVSTPILPALGGQTLVPGVYNTGGGTADLTGTLTLSGPGLYVIQTAALSTAAGIGASIVNLNGASPCDLWWTVASSAAIGTGSAMAGNVLALTSITVGTGASFRGRALAQTGTVTLNNNVVTACSGGTAPGFIVPAVGSGAVAIPTLSEWAMAILAGLLALAGFAALRRRER